ncbi:MAG: hypothetical protein EBU01_16190 [Crocinitomicaceae bacterium]|nr:hypothetical protein [Crocinitomicaceae bacterium]
MKLHHIVVLSHEKETFAVDFTPINQSSPITLFKLLFGVSVPGEVRIRHIDESKKHDEKYIIKTITFTKKNMTAKQLNKREYDKIKTEALHKIINLLFYWNTKMNLYRHNCQHFSHFVMKLAETIG